MARAGADRKLIARVQTRIHAQGPPAQAHQTRPGGTSQRRGRSRRRAQSRTSWTPACRAGSPARSAGRGPGDGMAGSQGGTAGVRVMLGRPGLWAVHAVPTCAPRGGPRVWVECQTGTVQLSEFAVSRAGAWITPGPRCTKPASRPPAARRQASAACAGCCQSCQASEIGR